MSLSEISLVVASVASLVTSPPSSFLSSTHERNLGSTVMLSGFFFAVPTVLFRAILFECSDEVGVIEVSRCLRLAKEKSYWFSKPVV